MDNGKVFVRFLHDGPMSFASAECQCTVYRKCFDHVHVQTKGVY